MRIAYIAAGAGGMLCGSCIHDNTLAAALGELGHQVALVPTYTPLRTDEASVAERRVFYGALSVVLEQRWRPYRYLPRALDRLLARPRLLTWISRFGAETDARLLGELTLSVLAGEEGPQARELDALVAWLRDDYRPEVVHITNSLLAGLARRIKREVGAPVVLSVQGEDLFVGELQERYREPVVAALRRRAADADAVVAPGGEYAVRMAELLALPAERFSVVPLGIRLDGHPPPSDGAAGEGVANRGAATVGYLARLCPEKGFHLLLEAFRELAAEPGREGLRLRVAGYLGAKDRPWFDEQIGRVREWGLADRVEVLGEVDRAGKLAFLGSLDLLSVPTLYREAKGLFVLEALASGVPVVQPEHGAFPEMLAATGGGLLVEPGSAPALAAGLRTLLDDRAHRRRLGTAGHAAVHARFDARTMAEATAAVYERLLVPAQDISPG